MMRLINRMAGAVLLLASASWVSAAGGNGAPSGAHYNLNIIGVDKGKTAPMTGSDRHTIFVGLGSKDEKATTSIWLTPGPFQVCDGNGFDAAYNCQGAQIGRGMTGAVFQLPCNTNVTTDVTCAEGTASASYSIWGRAVGTPGGSAIITTCAFDDTGTEVCSTDNTLDVFRRTSGKSTFQNVTQALTTLTGCYDVSGSVVCQTTALFTGDLQDFLWQYDNNGLRNAQLRFYLH